MLLEALLYITVYYFQNLFYYKLLTFNLKSCRNRDNKKENKRKTNHEIVKYMNLWEM